MISVLLVDDDALTLELHRTYLERLDGFRVVAECTGARAAVSAILERPPAEGIDLVLLDMTMPDGTGLDVLRHVLEGHHGAVLLGEPAQHLLAVGVVDQRRLGVEPLVGVRQVSARVGHREEGERQPEGGADQPMRAATASANSRVPAVPPRS